jgi:hypothetical protein
MSVNCDKISSIYKDCHNALGGIDQRIWLIDSSDVDYDSFSYSVTAGEENIISNIVLHGTSSTFEVIEFRKNLANLNETYDENPDGAVMFNQELVIPIHGRDAGKSRKISLYAAGMRELDIIVPQNDGRYVYLRKASLTSVADGTGSAMVDGSKYTITFTAQDEHLADYVKKSAVEDVTG